MRYSAQQLDRAVGAVIASAAGDALGSQYEFGPSSPTTSRRVRPPFGHAIGEWTDDTSMAMPILQGSPRRVLDDPDALGGIVPCGSDWSA